MYIFVDFQGSSLTEGNRGKRSKRSGPAANGNHDGDNHDAKNVSFELLVEATSVWDT